MSIPVKLRAAIWDVLAVTVIAFIAYKLLIAPRTLRERDAVPAPNVTLPTLEQRRFSLHDYRGKVVFLEFWASWCEPCKASLPMVEGFARTHPRVLVETVDVGESRAVAEEFARTHQMSNVALDGNHLAANWFGVEGFPTMIVIDTKGMIRAKWTGFNPAVTLNMAHAEAALHS